MGRAIVRLAIGTALLAVCATRIAGQSATVRAEGDQLHARAPGLSFIKGDPLARLKDGRTVRVDIMLAVHARPDGPSVAQTRTSFILSYDLWDERFAVARAGSPAESASYLTARAAETWCLDRATVPLAAIGRLGRDAPLWIRLEYVVMGGEAGASAGDAGITLRGLIDRLSQRREANELRDAVVAGPLMLTN